MHLPDGLLSFRVWGSLWVVAGGAMGYWSRRLRTMVEGRFVPLVGVTAAFIFAAQMLNFPVAGGTSGHLIGGVLAALLLGPSGGALTIAVVLIVQCLIFQDGGLTALGANIFNMSIIGAAGGYGFFTLLRRGSRRRGAVCFAAAVASWCSVVAASAACAVELALSGTMPLKTALPAMIAVHSLIGIGEGVITTLIIAYVMKVRPDLLFSVQGASGVSTPDTTLP